VSNGSASTVDHVPTTQQPSGPWAPSSWDRALAERHWKSLDPELQHYINKRETEAHQRIAALGQRAKSYDPFEPVLTQHQQWLQAKGANPAQVLNHFLGLQQEYERDPFATAMALMPPQFHQQLAQLREQAQMAQRNGMLFQAALAERERVQGEMARVQAEAQASMQKIAQEQAAAAERGRRSRALPVRGMVYSGPPTPRSINDTLIGVAKNNFPEFRP